MNSIPPGRPADETGAASATHDRAGARARHNIVGYVGIALAVAAFIGVASPSMLFEFVGGVLLIAALALSIVALFRPAPKWPAFVGIGLCAAAAVSATALFVVGFVNGYSGAVGG
ncbi:hypothetical protein MUN74_14150 [Agromyces endophyticus]|uniref:hypothetical protein n=1 Tax=Agromyces sp. H17E-10 TaxID=2932244 RepID=UPI001FD257CF|nr:hypothetical protein [Agromyces sp. H17E-10]UOQ88412.1 hypothetical protein MUN74_14150 [Agromyces sp. H17E-10]